MCTRTKSFTSAFAWELAKGKFETMVFSTYINWSYNLVTLGISQLDAYQTNKMIREAFNQIQQLYQNLNESKLQMATLSLYAASLKGSDGEDDIKNAIHDLKSAYYIGQKVLQSRSRYKHNTLIIKDPKQYAESLIYINTIIVALYDFIRDQVNKKIFIEEACMFYSEYVNDFFRIDCDVLQKINPGFVETQYVRDLESLQESLRYDGASFYDLYKEERYISNLGFEFVEQEKKKLIKDYKSMLERITYVNS